MAFENELTVLWTTDNLITSRDMVFMYTVNAKKTWLVRESGPRDLGSHRETNR